MHELDELARRYSPVFSDLERTLPGLLGDLVWDERGGPSMVTLRDGRRMQRAGLIRAEGVFGLTDPAALDDALRDLLERHGFNADGPIHADKAAGYLMMTGRDGRRAEFTFRTKTTMEAWIDVPC